MDVQSKPGFFSFQGQASLGVVCRDGVKARGVSITRSLVPGDFTAYYNTAHEMGHQFGATHTFNATTGNCLGKGPLDRLRAGHRFNNYGLPIHLRLGDLRSGDNYFHIASLEQIVNYTNDGPGNPAPVR